MPKQWKIYGLDPQLQAQLSDALDVHPIVAQLLINREIVDIHEARDFLAADLSGMHDPFLMKHMQRAVTRIRQAQANKEKVFVVGDYDVDGVTSAALLNNIFTQMGIEVIHYIPHRMVQGYGLNDEVGGLAENEGAKLLVAVDCGITAFREVELINQHNIDVIILDHHEPAGGRIPAAYAVVNPKQQDCGYPFKHLASVGLVTKLTQALLGIKKSERVLDLAAIGTVADVVPLRGENRIFVKAGLPKISVTENHGLMALMDVAKIKGKELSPFHIGFILGPRINAAGRMDSAQASLDLFLSKDSLQAHRLAKVLDKHNVQRQKIQSKVIEEAMAIVEQEVNFKDEKVIVLSKKGWHKGVLGIVAARLSDKYYRPAVVISIEGGIGTASARSIDGFHLHDALQQCARYLENFGGHAGAAGLTIKEENIDLFRGMINDVAKDILSVKKLLPTLVIDCEIPLSSITMELADIINAMAPFGESNPAPVFCVRGVSVKSAAVVMGKNTIKFWVKDKDFAISAIGFGMAESKPMVKPGRLLDMAFEIVIDAWNKAPTPQLKLRDLKESGSQ